MFDDFEFEYVDPWEAEKRKDAQLRSQGFSPVWTGAMVIGGPYTRPDHWQCRRGCGTLVWDPEAHMANVCIEWNPRAGES